MKLRIKIILGIVFFLLLFLGTSVYILYLSQFHLDLSQDYRSIEGYENIVFKDSKSDQCFRLCAWGLIRAESYPEFQDHRETIGIPYDEYRSLIEHADGGYIWQAVSSPDGRYILYVEKVGISGITDDEDVYYKVYSPDDGTTTTIYSGYRQYLLVDWK